MTEVKKALPVDHKTIGTQRVTRFKTQFNAIPDPGNPLPGELPSMTIPNEAMTVREIIAMQARGLTLNNRRVPVYNGEEDIPDFQHLDLADQEAIMQTNQALITEMQKTLKDQEKAYVDAKRKKEQEEIEEKIERRLRRAYGDPRQMSNQDIESLQRGKEDKDGK